MFTLRRFAGAGDFAAGIAKSLLITSNYLLSMPQYLGHISSVTAMESDPESGLLRSPRVSPDQDSRRKGDFKRVRNSAFAVRNILFLKLSAVELKGIIADDSGTYYFTEISMPKYESFGVSLNCGKTRTEVYSCIIYFKLH